MSETPSTSDKSPVLKALRLLAQVASRADPPGLAELSRAMNLPKPTTFRLARALEGAGFIRKDPLTLRYQVGQAFEEVALNGLRNSAAHGTRRKLMNELAERLGARVNLVVLKAGNLSFVQWVDSTAPLRIDIGGDMPMPVHCSASGKLLLAFGPAELREGFLRSAPFASHTKNTITTARGLARELAAIRQRGYSIDDQELLPGVNCLAVPVYSGSGEIVAGLAVMAPTASLPLARLTSHLPDIKDCAARISAQLGWEPAHHAEIKLALRPRLATAAHAPPRARQAREANSKHRSAK